MRLRAARSSHRSRGPTCFVSDATSACGPKAAFLSPFDSRGESETRRRTDTQSTTPVCECQRPTAVNATRSPLWEGSFHDTGGGRRRSGYPPNVAFSCEHREQARRPKGAVRSVGVRQLQCRVGPFFRRTVPFPYSSLRVSSAYQSPTHFTSKRSTENVVCPDRRTPRSGVSLQLFAFPPITMNVFTPVSAGPPS